MASKEGYMGFPRPLQHLAIASAIVVIALLGVTSASRADYPRVPQIQFSPGSLQSYLDGQGQSIDVTTDQTDAQIWTSNVSGTAEFTLMIELAAYANKNAIGVYNIDDPNPNPTQFLVFPGAATAGWSATVRFFDSGVMKVLLSDEFGDFAGQTNYSGVNRYRFGFYLQGPGGLFYSQDSRNGGGAAQILTYAATGISTGGWWECFEDLVYQGTSPLTDFEDALMFIQSVNPEPPVPAHRETWGGLKSIYR